MLRSTKKTSVAITLVFCFTRDLEFHNINRDLQWFLQLPREEAVRYISEEEYDSLPWAWEKAGDPRWEVELIRRMAYGEGGLSVIAKGTLAMMEKFGLPKSWLDRTDAATNANLLHNGYPNHHGPAEAWQVGMLYNLVYNRDYMVHEIVCETGSGVPTRETLEKFDLADMADHAGQAGICRHRGADQQPKRTVPLFHQAPHPPLCKSHPRHGRVDRRKHSHTTEQGIRASLSKGV